MWGGDEMRCNAGMDRRTRWEERENTTREAEPSRAQLSMCPESEEKVREKRRTMEKERYEPVCLESGSRGPWKSYYP